MKIPHNKKCSYYFEEICKYPHGSYNEKPLSDYIVQFAKERNLKYIQDEMYNVVVYKNATPGFESAPAVLLQAHIDMVPEKNADSTHDFLTDPIDIRLEDGFVKANNTTLGADDGHGVSYMLALLDENDYNHPAIECAFTVQEEVGLFGAANLKKEYFNAKNYICLDGGGEYKTLISSAGGQRVEIKKDYTKEEVTTTVYSLKIRGLKGGHSGGNIDQELGNSNKLAGRILYHLQKSVDLQLVSINGGLQDNAIPRECDVVFASSESIVEDIVRTQEQLIKTLLEFSDEGFFVELASSNKTVSAYSVEDSKKIIKLLYLLPNGLLSKSMKIPGLTLTSLNLGIVKTVENTVEFNFSLRSAINESIEEMAHSLEELCSLFDASILFDAYYPGWNYKEENSLRDTLFEVFKEQYGYDMDTVAAHGGCECGIFSTLLDPINVISYGPICDFIHTPDERMDHASFERCYDVLKSLLSKLAC